jgi:hypothetical protein
MNAVLSARLVALDPSVADSLRARGGVPYVADSIPGYPCRQCLRDAQIGEELLLVSYDPFETDSPYRSASPIFIHRQPCGSPDTSELPVQLTGRRLSVRAFDSGEMMVDASLIEGRDLARTIDTLFADETVDHLHVHNEPRGCFAARVDRR